MERMTVPLLDLKPQYAPLKAEIMAALEAVCDSQMFILGPSVTALEKACGEYCQSAHSLGVSSGTDALLLALMALDIGPEHEVITSPYTFFATGGTIARVGARPVWVDIDPNTFNLSPAAVQTFIDKQCERSHGQLVNRATGNAIKAIMPVHLYGQLTDMAPLIEIARRYDLKVIEDAAQAIGSEALHGKRAGSFGDIGCFSFFPTKNLGAFGDAGLCTTQDAELAERMRVLRVHGGKPKYYHGLIGGNFRIDELQAAVLNIKLRHLDGWTRGRQRNALFYERAFTAAGLNGKVRIPQSQPGYRHVWNQYVIRAPRRDALRDYLAENDVGTEIYYPVPLHLQTCFAALGGKPGDFPESERAASETLALPIFSELTEEQLAYVVACISAFYSS
jgi:dTDP-4-amino-4,6-dideoxygalactose transaminase